MVKFIRKIRYEILHSFKVSECATEIYISYYILYCLVQNNFVPKWCVYQFIKNIIVKCNERHGVSSDIFCWWLKNKKECTFREKRSDKLIEHDSSFDCENKFPLNLNPVRLQKGYGYVDVQIKVRQRISSTSGIRKYYMKLLLMKNQK